MDTITDYVFGEDVIDLSDLFVNAISTAASRPDTAAEADQVVRLVNDTPTRRFRSIATGWGPAKAS